MVLCFTVNAKAAGSPALSARSAIVIASDGSSTPLIIHEKNAHERMGMASTTKIMTALVALSLSDTEKKIAVHENATGIEGSSVYLVKGETLTLGELIYALLLSSANDAASAIAIGLCGSEEAFVDEMNKKALSMGLSNTHFVNPHGLYHEEHYTTAYELSLIAEEALKNDFILSAVSTYKTTIPHPELEYGRLLVNHNKMLKLYPSTIGVKTGFTKKTGRCLVSAAEQNGMRLIAVTLDAPDDWNDHKKMLDLGFDSYELKTIYEKNEFLYEISLVGGEKSSAILTNARPIKLILPKHKNTDNIKTEVFSSYRFLYAPISQGRTVATLVVEYEGRVYCSDLITTESIPKKIPEKKGFFSRIFGK
ncbi:MAG: D-alanyl-D-alanine carboxypeptidase [Clostridia bacterium]|nr:D-alanyl-D-alanine carboxypeptidase [Clostridia bacterium]